MLKDRRGGYKFNASITKIITLSIALFLPLNTYLFQEMDVDGVWMEWELSFHGPQGL